MGMRFFGELFEKKICPICGGEIGLLGNRRLADGNLCKKCARKLSPWFDERRESTAAQIDEQLRDRERNLEELRGFSSSREVGNGGRLMIDEADPLPSQRSFAAAARRRHCAPSAPSSRRVKAR